MYAEKFVRIFIEDILDDFYWKMGFVVDRELPEAITAEEREKVGDEIAEILLELLDNF